MTGIVTGLRPGGFGFVASDASTTPWKLAFRRAAVADGASTGCARGSGSGSVGCRSPATPGTTARFASHRSTKRSGLGKGHAMRRWFIAAALFANALASGLLLLQLLNGGGWGEAARLSVTDVEVLVIAAAAAFALNLLLVPVLGISFWARDRGTRRLEARLAARPESSPDGPVAPSPAA